MKRISLLFFYAFFALHCLAQEEFLAKIHLPGQIGELGVSPSGALWVASRFGHVYYKESTEKLWHPGAVVFNGQSLKTPGYDRVNFFDDSRLMISGYISAKDQMHDLILRSVDAGKSWQAVRFGKESMIDAAWVTKSGKAWMSGSSQILYHSQDFGETWTQLNKVEENNSVRISSIHFASDELTGLFGTTWDIIYLTKDGGRSWEKIPTPLKQRKYVRIANEIKPEIKKVRLLGEKYIINQQGRIFHAAARDIDWKLLNGVDDFEVTENGQVYVVYKDLSIGLLDRNLKSLYRSRERLSESPVTVKVQHNKLFALAGGKIFTIDPQLFLSDEMLTNAYPIELPPLRTIVNGEEIGFDKNDVLKFDKSSGRWYRYFQTPFTIRNATRYDEQIVLTEPALEQHFTFDPVTKKLSPFVLPNRLFDVTKNSIDEFTVEQGKKAKQYVEVHFKKFVRSGKAFKLEDADGDNFLPNMPDNIHVQRLNELIYEIDRSKGKLATIADLQLKQTDIVGYKKFISREETNIRKFGVDPYDFSNFFRFPGENIDFSFYRNMADSLAMLAPEKVGTIFNRIPLDAAEASTWKRITINFSNGKQLFIENNDARPNYFYAPWILSYDGLVFKSSSMTLSKLINELTLRDLLGGMVLDKNYALFQIADHLYRETLPLHGLGNEREW